MPRQIKWFLIIVAGLAVFGLGQLGESLATQPGGGEAHHGPPGAPPAPPPTAPPAPSPTVTAPGAVARDLPPPPSTTPRVAGGGCGGGSTPAPPPSPQELANLREEVATYNRYADQYEATANELQSRINRGLTADDDKWLESHTAATATGYRGQSYQGSPDIIKTEMDNFEKFKGGRDLGQVMVLAMGAGTPQGRRRSKFIVEIQRTRAFARQLRQKAQEAQQKLQNLESQGR